MKEIKFRGYHKKLKRMFTAEEMGADELTMAVDGRGFVNISGDLPQDSIYCVSLIPMQYTGLKDRNEKEKFKDDIVRSVNGRIWVIKRGHYKMTMPGTLINLYGWYMEGDGCQQPISDGDEIIGNIHENPELLK